MIPGTWTVNCKGCRKPIITCRDDPFQTTDDGSPVYSASCAGCGTTTKYRRPAPVVEAPAYAPPEVPNSALADMVKDESAFNRTMRLPDIVIQAAWWLRITLMAVWFFGSLWAMNVFANQVIKYLTRSARPTIDYNVRIVE